MAENSSKGNPAQHRMSNKPRKERRQSGWARGVQRKEMRRTKQDDAHKANLLAGRLGQLTPWQVAQAKRRERRLNDPNVPLFYGSGPES